MLLQQQSRHCRPFLYMQQQSHQTVLVQARHGDVDSHMRLSDQATGCHMREGSAHKGSSGSAAAATCVTAEPIYWRELVLLLCRTLWGARHCTTLPAGALQTA